jgi:ATP-dependent RNA helicase DOB1
MVLKTEKKALTRVLKRTGLVEKSVVTLKGNVVCEISSNHEILLTQLMFSGFFSDIGPNEIAAVLSSVVHD